MRNDSELRNGSKAPLLIVVLATLLGAHVGIEYSMRYGPLFVGRAGIFIESKMPILLITPRHDLPREPLRPEYEPQQDLIAAPKVIAACLERHPELMKLRFGPSNA